MTGECWLNPRNISVCSASNTNLTQAATAEVQLTVRGEGLGPDSAATAATAAVVPVRVRGVLSFSYQPFDDGLYVRPPPPRPETNKAPFPAVSIGCL